MTLNKFWSRMNLAGFWLLLHNKMLQQVVDSSDNHIAQVQRVRNILHVMLGDMAQSHFEDTGCKTGGTFAVSVPWGKKMRILLRQQEDTPLST
jgi:hypothetical protein